MAFKEFYVGKVGAPQSLPTNREMAFPEECVGAVCCEFIKVFNPPPFQLQAYPVGDGIRIIFEENEFAETCTCQVECVGSPSLIPPGGTASEQFCPAQIEHIFDIDIDIVEEGQPFPILFTFTDTLGNISTIDFRSLVLVKPSLLLKNVELQDGFHYVELGVPYTTVDGVDIRPDIYQYQIEEYVHNEENRSVIYDWITPATLANPVHKLQQKDASLFYRQIRANIEYGYRIRYRTVFDEASKWSNWITAKAPDDL